jgi:hypothetical protein
MPWTRATRSSSLLFALAALVLGACVDGGRVVDSAAPSPITEGDDGDGAGLCAVESCHGDDECVGCAGGRLTCLVAERRCVACDPALGTGCAEGEVCSAYGACVAEGQTCPMGENGLPDISCSSNADCGACDPLHQVCDPAWNRCVACSPSDTGACSPSDICVQGACAPACPADCQSDLDCASCGGPGHYAHACNAGSCAQCSLTSPCPGSLVCNAQGLCEDPVSEGGGGGDPGSGGGDPGSGGADPGTGGGDVGEGGGPVADTCHDLCTAGEAMEPSCDPCAADLCAADPYCCSTAWDSLCVSEVDQYCNNACSGSADSCAHPECAQGDALDATCSECAAALCAADPYCCSTSWDSLCVTEVAMYCANGC